MLDNSESALVQNCIKENWISSKGKYIEKFEKSFSKNLVIDSQQLFQMEQLHYTWLY